MVRKISKPYIHGKALELLQELIKDGCVYTGKNRKHLRFLQKLFPSIRRSQYKGKSIYYLKDKNAVALREMLKQNTSRVINYRELSNMSKTFHTDLSKPEKKRFFGKKGQISRRKKQRSKEKKVYVYKEKQKKIDDFLGRFLHSEVLAWYCKMKGWQFCGVKSVVTNFFKPLLSFVLCHPHLLGSFVFAKTKSSFFDGGGSL